MDDADRAARSFARGIGAAYDLPVFLYAASASSEARRDLASIRKGGTAGLALRMEQTAWTPDFGPPRLDPRWGASVVGARYFLVAFNVLLASADLDAARRIARSVRQSSGGLPAVKAIGVPLASRGGVQVSMNLIDYRVTSLARAFDAVEAGARREGLEIERSEIVGLVPEAAIDGVRPEKLGLEGFSDAKILEWHLRRLGLA
jgi:glutamate formiminotransferase